MTDLEILLKSLKKAINNGYKNPIPDDMDRWIIYDLTIDVAILIL